MANNEKRFYKVITKGIDEFGTQFRIEATVQGLNSALLLVEKNKLTSKKYGIENQTNTWFRRIKKKIKKHLKIMNRKIRNGLYFEYASEFAKSSVIAQIELGVDYVLSGHNFDLIRQMFENIFYAKFHHYPKKNVVEYFESEFGNAATNYFDN